MTQVNKPRPRAGKSGCCPAERPLTPREAAICSSPIDAQLDSGLFRGLCDPTRLLLLGCLAKCGRRCTVSEVAGCTSVDLSVVSRHLSLLEGAGVVESTRQGRTVYYSVKYSELSARFRALADALDVCSPAPPVSSRKRGSVGSRSA
jgi:ArsR family transcriptional regulator